MANTVEGVESEWRGEDSLASNLDAGRERLHGRDNVLAGESGGRDKVGKREAVEHCECEVDQRTTGYYVRTLRPTPVTRLAMDASHVS